MKRKLFHLMMVTATLCGTAGAYAQSIFTFAGTGPGGYSGDSSYAVLARLNGPGGVAVNAAGVTYICDNRNNVIRSVDAGGIIQTFAGTGTNGYSGDGGAATAARMSPTAVATDRFGNVYVTESRNGTIRKINTSGVISTVAGDGSTGYSGDGGAATAAQLNRPAGIAIDTAGNIFVADSRNNVVRKVNTAGVISTIAGTGTAGYSGDGSAATAAALNRPAGIAVKDDGTLYIADAGNNVVRVINTSGVINTFAGTGTAGFSGDGGAATAATLSNPGGLALDASGNLLVADVVNNVIRQVSTSGVISTMAGINSPGYSGDGGLAVSAAINTPGWVNTDASGNVYISDGGNNVIRRIGAAVRSIVVHSSTGDTVCIPATFHFNATVFAYSTPHYQWRVNGAGVGTDSSGLTYTTLRRGDRINCFLMDSIGGHTLAMSNMLVADSLPNAGTVVGPTSLCVGSTAIYRDSVGAGFPAMGTWSVTNSSASLATGGGPTRLTGVTTGLDTLIFSTTNVCGTSTSSLVVTVVNNPIAPITGPDTMCGGETVTFSDSTAGGTWSIRPRRMGDSIDASGNYTAGPRGGIVYIVYSIAAGCSLTDSVVVDSLPRVAPIGGPSVVNMLGTITLTDPTTGGVWSSSDTSIATVDPATGIVYGVSVGTVMITYSITSPAGCIGYQVYPVSVLAVSAITNVAYGHSISVSPNPAYGTTLLSWTGLSTGSGQVTIADIAGRTVYTTNVNFGTAKGSLQLPLANFEKGIYLVRVQSPVGLNTIKLVVE